MHRWIFVIFSGLVLLVMNGAGLAFAANTGGYYSIRPPRLSVPDGEPGAVRRLLMQFYGWTLICDEILERKQMVCNATQAVVDSSNNEVFSWSLAVTDSGRPFMLLRTPVTADKSIPVRLGLKGRRQPVKIPFVGCDANVCLAQTPVGPVLTKAIEEEAAAVISYQSSNGGRVVFDVSFVGLRQAVASIR